MHYVRVQARSDTSSSARAPSGVPRLLRHPPPVPWLPTPAASAAAASLIPHPLSSTSSATSWNSGSPATGRERARKVMWLCGPVPVNLRLFWAKLRREREDEEGGGGGGGSAVGRRPRAGCGGERFLRVLCGNTRFERLGRGGARRGRAEDGLYFDEITVHTCDDTTSGTTAESSVDISDEMRNSGRFVGWACRVSEQEG